MFENQTHFNFILQNSKESGACGPQAVKTEVEKKRAVVVALAALGLRPAPPPRFLILTATPLIGAGLVGCISNH